MTVANQMTRRWFPWAVVWAALAALTIDGDIAGNDRAVWAVVFATTLIAAIVAGITQRRSAMNLLVAAVTVIGITRSYQYAQLDAWGPQGVWALVVGTLLLAWSVPPQSNLTNQHRPNRRSDMERRQHNLAPAFDRRTTLPDRRLRPPSRTA